MKKSNSFFTGELISKLMTAVPSIIGYWLFNPIPKVLGINYINYPYLRLALIVELKRT